MRGRDAGVVGLVMHGITSQRPQDAVPGPFGRTNPWWVRPTPRALGWLPGVRRLAFGQGMRWEGANHALLHWFIPTWVAVCT